MKYFRITYVNGAEPETKLFGTHEEAYAYAVETAEKNSEKVLSVFDLGDVLLLKVVVTDTHDGFAVHTWNKRYEEYIPVGLSSRSIVIRAKTIAGWKGVRCIKTDHGDLIELVPNGIAEVMFIRVV